MAHNTAAATTVATDADRIEDVRGMVRRAEFPMSGQCIICGEGEYVGYPHDACQIRLVKAYAELVLPSGEPT